MILSSFTFSPLYYIDPGSGSIILQMVIAALLGAGVIIRSQWSKIKKLFGGKPANDDDTGDGEENGDN